MEYLVNIIDSIVWPVAILVMYFGLRKPIGELILFVKSIKYKDLEVTFGEKMKEIIADVEDSGIQTKLPPEEIEDIYRIVETSPVGAIIESWKELETTAREKISELVKDKDSFIEAQRRPLTRLEFSGALIPSTARAIRDLQLLRNKVAHTKQLRLSNESVVEYVTLAKTITDQIKSITELPKQKHKVLTIIILEINHLIDTGKYNHISIQDVHEHIKNKDIFEFLEREAGEDFDSSIFGEDGPYSIYVRYYYEQMYRLYGGSAGNERRKWGVENSGLCLLVAWTNELLQQGSGWYPSE